MHNYYNYLKNFSLGLLVFATACASNRYVKDPKDPLEPFNRTMFQFNKTVDALYLKPISEVYTAIIPAKLRNLVKNFFKNVGEIPTIINSVLQANFKQAMDSTARFTINSTLGMAGLFDLAANTKLQASTQDFGKTLAVWGYKDSNYLVLPIIGPSTVRDGFGFVVNNFMQPAYYFKPKWRNRYEASYIISRRSDLKEAQSFLATAGVDEYALLRDVYLQKNKLDNADPALDPELLDPPE